MSKLNLTGKITIGPTPAFKEFDRMIFGQFLEHFHSQVYGGIFEPGSSLANEKGFRLDVIKALRELTVPIVRWPGGCFVSAYHWKDGVGKKRFPIYNKAWCVEEQNTFGTDEFAEWCSLIKAEPYICTNAGTGTPEEMSDWVEYCNLKSSGKWAKLRQSNGFKEPHNIKYWSIGNENYFKTEIGSKTVAEWGHFVNVAALMMKRVDNSIKLLAAAIDDNDWTSSLLKEAGGLLDYISIHHYWDRLWDDNRPKSYIECMTFCDQIDSIIEKTEDTIAKAGYEGKIGIAFDEWNLRSWHHPFTKDREGDKKAWEKNDINSTYTMADAIFSASFLNSCIRHSDTVKMANMAPVVNTRGPLFVHTKGIVKRTSFHVFSMYANLLEKNVADIVTKKDKSVEPYLDVLATCNDHANKWALSFSNRHRDRELYIDISIGKIPFENYCRLTTLSGDSTDTYNDIDYPDRVVPVVSNIKIQKGKIKIPAHSLVICEIGL